MKLPEIQAELLSIAHATGNGRLIELAEMMSRRSPKRRALNQSVKVTPELREEIRTFAFYHDTWTFADIAKHFNVNPGRVSEAVSGCR